jgi:hypothetical protein
VAQAQSDKASIALQLEMPATDLSGGCSITQDRPLPNGPGASDQKVDTGFWKNPMPGQKTRA